MVIFQGKYFCKVINFPTDFFRVRRELHENYPYSISLPKKYYKAANDLLKYVNAKNRKDFVGEYGRTIIITSTDHTSQLVLKEFQHFTTHKQRFNLFEPDEHAAILSGWNLTIPKPKDIKWTLRFL